MLHCLHIHEFADISRRFFLHIGYDMCVGAEGGAGKIQDLLMPL